MHNRASFGSPIPPKVALLALGLTLLPCQGREANLSSHLLFSIVPRADHLQNLTRDNQATRDAILQLCLGRKTGQWFNLTVVRKWHTSPFRPQSIGSSPVPKIDPYSRPHLPKDVPTDTQNTSLRREVKHFPCQHEPAKSRTENCSNAYIDMQGIKNDEKSGKYDSIKGN